MINAWQSNVEALQDAHYMEVKKCHNTIEEVRNNFYYRHRTLWSPKTMIHYLKKDNAATSNEIRVHSTIFTLNVQKSNYGQLLVSWLCLKMPIEYIQSVRGWTKFDLDLQAMSSCCVGVCMWCMLYGYEGYDCTTDILLNVNIKNRYLYQFHFAFTQYLPYHTNGFNSGQHHRSWLSFLRPINKTININFY